MATTGDTAVVLLKSPKDWTRWLALIKTKAVNNDIWQHIDPSVPSPPQFEPPAKPLAATFAPNAEDATVASLTATQFQRYNAEVLVWQEELKDHRKKVKVITEIEDHVIRTAGTYWSTIESVTGLHARLVKLKERVAPSTYAREQEVIRRYEHVRNHAESTRTEEWLAEWESALRDAIELKLPDVQDTRPTRQFLLAVEKIAPLFAQTWLNTIETKAVMTPDIQLGTVIPDGFQIAQIFRNQHLLNKAAKGAFASSTPQEEETSSTGSTLQGEQAPTGPRSKKCPIHYHHNIDECYSFNKAKRPEDWSWGKGTASRVIKFIENDSKAQKKYKDILTEAREFLKKSETASEATETTKTTTQSNLTTQSNPKVIGSAFAHPPRVSFASTPYTLKDSFILDSGSPNHICNSKDRFEPNSFQELDVPEPVLTGDDMSYITGYGEVLIRICTPTGEALFRLKEVAYISGFHTNVVAHKRLRKAGYSWDDVNNGILKDNEVVFYLEERDEQYVIEYNTPKAAFPASSTPRPPRDASFQLEEPGPEPIPEDLESDLGSDTESTIYVIAPNTENNGQEAHQDRQDESAKNSSTEGAAYPTPDSSRDSSPQDDVGPFPGHVTPEEASPEPQDEQQQRPRRDRQLTERAQQNINQSGNPYQAGYAVTPVTLASFHIGTQHRLHRRNLPPEPRSWKELQHHAFKAEFTEATKKEWDNLCAMKTAPLPLTWVFKYKYDKHGFLTKFRARICVRGDLQPPSEKDTYAATLAAKSFRILMALAARWDLQLKQLDAVNAFPNSPLDEEVYVELPDGFKQPGMIGRLLRALYGLRRSPMLWPIRLRTALRHVDIHNNWARQEVQNKTFTVKYLETDKMPADGLTKALPKSKFKVFVEQLGLTSVPQLPEDEEEDSPLV